ncbi:hypothetical protein [Streptomyces sp. NPDC096311]|uniref:hypothetical protein n=1 Tax=Streptomyces sp. NPDC096311 TaxID=3366083 RepID=UPI0037FEF268
MSAETTTLTVATQLYSAVCSTAVIVVRPPRSDVRLTCGGRPMLAKAPTAPDGSPDPALAGGSLLSKRYLHEASGLEVVCAKAGDGTLAVDGEPLNLQGPKPLPSSD